MPGSEPGEPKKKKKTMFQEDYSTFCGKDIGYIYIGSQPGKQGNQLIQSSSQEMIGGCTTMAIINGQEEVLICVYFS